MYMYIIRNHRNRPHKATQRQLLDILLENPKFLPPYCFLQRISLSTSINAKTFSFLGITASERPKRPGVPFGAHRGTLHIRTSHMYMYMFKISNSLGGFHQNEARHIRHTLGYPTALLQPTAVRHIVNKYLSRRLLIRSECTKRS